VKDDGEEPRVGGDRPPDTSDAYRPPASDDDLLAECAVETFRSGGPGGQHQNVTESGVRLRHRPTGITVTCRSERSQHQNKRTCVRRLRERIEQTLRTQAPRRATRPSRRARQARLDEKARRSSLKRQRRRPAADD